MLIVIAALSLLGATASLLVPEGRPPRAAAPRSRSARAHRGLGGLEDRSVRQHDPPMSPKGWRDRS